MKNTWTLEDYKQFERRINKALDSVPMATDEPADINIINMRNRITEMRDLLKEIRDNLPDGWYQRNYFCDKINKIAKIQGY